MEFFVKNGKLLLNNREIRLKGINWFGPETDTRCVHALWEVNLNDLISVLKRNSFNAVRLTISAETMLGLDTLKVGGVSSEKNKGLENMTCGQLMDIVVRRLREAGILIMFNMHRMKPTEDISELWYTDEYPETRVIQAWRNLAQRYRNSPNVFAMDIKNEPHGKSSWGGARETDWAAACERIGKEIHKVSPKVLICVAGVTMDIWGDDVDGARTRPVKLDIPNKVFYSPHFYIHWRYPNKEGYSHIPYLERCMGRFVKAGGCVVIGEYGYDHTNMLDTQWVKEFADYLKNNKIENAFYWCLNFNGALNHTILEKDWKTTLDHKMKIINEITPSPTQFDFTSASTSTTPPRPPTPMPPRPSTPPSSTPSTPSTPMPPKTSNPPPNRPNTSIPITPNQSKTGVEIKSRLKYQWKEGNMDVFEQEVVVTNTSDKIISNVELDIVGTNVKSNYSSVLKSNGNNVSVSFPDWQIKNKLAPKQSWMFGFQAFNVQGKVNVRNIMY
jgi:endoglucanase